MREQKRIDIIEENKGERVQTCRLVEVGVVPRSLISSSLFKPASTQLIALDTLSYA